MLMAAATEFLRAFTLLARRVDGDLAEAAARNAAIVVTERSARRFEETRTMRDLAQLGLPDEPTPCVEDPLRAATAEPGARR